MSRYRYVFRCKECKKIYTSYWKQVLFEETELCQNCGSEGKLELVIAKPKLFRLKGWEVKGEE